VDFIESENPAIETLAFDAVGMGEGSTNDISVTIRQQVKKGDLIGMFHFGGSTHVLPSRKMH
jgi:phosphatidylserine decarboxylase